MKALRRRVERLPARPCRVCRDWGRVVFLADREAPSPWPTVCPACGRQVIRLVRVYVGIPLETGR